MQNVLIVEDDAIQSDFLYNTVKENFPGWNVDIASDLKNADFLISKSIQRKNSYSLFLLDIQLSSLKNDRGGFIIAENIRKIPSYYHTPILFLTAVTGETSFALSNFHCYNYISKPYSSTDIIKQLNNMLLTGFLENTIELHDTNRVLHKLYINDIIVIEAQSHTIHITTQNGNLDTREYSLSGILDVLGNNFIQCHKKFIVRKDLIKSIDNVTQTVHLSLCNLTVPIGRKYLPNLQTLV